MNRNIQLEDWQYMIFITVSVEDVPDNKCALYAEKLAKGATYNRLWLG
jgi:hypothetical protein